MSLLPISYHNKNLMMIFVLNVNFSKFLSILMQYKDEIEIQKIETSDFDIIAKTDIVTAYVSQIYSDIHNFFENSSDLLELTNILRALATCSIVCLKQGIELSVDEEAIAKILHFFSTSDNEFINNLIIICITNMVGTNDSIIDLIYGLNIFEIAIHHLVNLKCSLILKGSLISLLTNIIMYSDNNDENIPLETIYCLFDDVIPELFNTNKYQECAFYFTKSVYDYLDKNEIDEEMKLTLFEMILKLLDSHEIINSLCTNYQFQFLFDTCKKKPEMCNIIFESIQSIVIPILNQSYEKIPSYFHGCLKLIVEFLQNPDTDKHLYIDFLNSIDYDVLNEDNIKNLELTPEITTIFEHGLRSENERCIKILTCPSSYYSLIDDILCSTNDFKLPVFKILVLLLDRNNDETCEYLLECNFFETVQIISENPTFALYELIIIRSVITYLVQNGRNVDIPEGIIENIELNIDELDVEMEDTEDKIISIFEEIKILLNLENQS